MEKSENKFGQSLRLERLSPASLYLFLLILITNAGCVKSAIIETREKIKNEIRACDAILLAPDLPPEYADPIFEEFGITSWDELKINDVINKCSSPEESLDSFENRLIKSIKKGNPAAALLMDKVIDDISRFEAKDRPFFPTSQKEAALKDMEMKNEEGKEVCKNSVDVLRSEVYKSLPKTESGISAVEISLDRTLKECFEEADRNKSKVLQELAAKIKKYNENPYSVIRERRLNEAGLTEAELKNNISRLPEAPKRK